MAKRKPIRLPDKHRSTVGPPTNIYIWVPIDDPSNMERAIIRYEYPSVFAESFWPEHDRFWGEFLKRKGG